MKRRKYNNKEQDELQKYKRENDKLKRQVSSLRKQLAKIDIGRYENLQDMMQKFDAQEVKENQENDIREQEKKWKCHNCSDGVLRLKVFERQDGIMYFRKCDNCDNRTELKKWNKNVEGVE
jgi:Zn finger protein HypA/HybF involved in hydrogenase expression